LWRAVRASLAIPGVITPAIDNGHFLVDGGLLNNLPVDLMNQRSNGPVLAIDVTDINSFDTPLSSIPNAWSIAWKKWITRQQVPIPTILETLVRSTMLASYSKRNDNKRKVDYYIQPDVKEFGILEFTKAAQVIEKGYETGIAIVEDLDKTLTNINNA
jgi:NTE family protein